MTTTLKVSRGDLVLQVADLLKSVEAIELEAEAQSGIDKLASLGLMDVLRVCDMVACSNPHRVADEESGIRPVYTLRNYQHHLHKALSHLGRAGKPDEDSDIDHIYHAIVRLMMAAKVKSKTDGV